MKYCDKLFQEISFNLDGVTPCRTSYTFGAPRYSLDDFDIQKQNRKILHDLNEKINEYSCKNCIYLKDDNNFNSNELLSKKISSILLHHWTTCNCNCVYCDNQRVNIWNEKPKYDPYEFIKAAYEQEQIDRENLIVRILGGDLCVLPNFNDFMNLFEENGFGIIHFSTNNIIYQPRIEKVLKAGKGSLNVSIDCGTKETYKKIKRVDKFEDCINNLKKYASVSDNISIHYILLKGYNDNEREIRNFFKLMKETGVKCVGINIDHKDVSDYILAKTPIKNINKYKTLITLFCNLAHEYSFRLDNDNDVELNFLLKNYKISENIFTKVKNLFKKI